MTTQVTFIADKSLKNKALLKARQEGIPLKTLFVYAMKGFVEGKISLGLETTARPRLIELGLSEVSGSLKKQAARARKIKSVDLISI